MIPDLAGLTSGFEDSHKIRDYNVVGIIMTGKMHCTLGKLIRVTVH